jgi:VWFA-related protein
MAPVHSTSPPAGARACRRRSRIAAGLLLAVTAGVHATSQQQPVFRSRVDVVTVDVSVLGRDGRPILGLSPDDFVVEVDGQARKLVSAQYVPYHTSAVENAPAATDTAAASNEHVATGRVILVAVDQGNIRRVEGRAALKAASSFIDALDPADRVAAVAIDDVAPIHFSNDRPHVKRVLGMLTGRATSMAFEFNLGISEALAVSTGNRTHLNEVVLRECGQPLWRIEDMERIAAAEGVRDPCPVRVEQEARMIAQSARNQGEQSVDAIRRLVRRLEDIEGPKTLVLLSEGLIAEPQLVDLTDISALAQKARVTIYVLQLDVPAVDVSDSAVSPTLGADVRARGDGLARLAGAGGGALFQLVGRDALPFSRILQELSGYYLLAFEPTAADRDGRAHRINVSVRRPAATVRSRPAFQAPAVPTAPMTVEERLVQLLRTRRLSTELPLRVAAHHTRAAAPGQVHAIITLQAEAPESDITFGIVVVDDKGVVATSATHRTTTGGYSFPAVLPEGRYLLRAAAVEASGRTGTVERPLDAAVRAAGPVQSSDLFLYLKPVRPGEKPQPIIDRTSAAALVASIEVYADRNWAAAPEGVRLHVAAGGTGEQMTIVLPLRWSAAGCWVAVGDVKLEGLPAGRYVAAAEMPGGGRVERTFYIVRP